MRRARPQRRGRADAARARSARAQLTTGHRHQPGGRGFAKLRTLQKEVGAPDLGRLLEVLAQHLLALEAEAAPPAGAEPQAVGAPHRPMAASLDATLRAVQQGFLEGRYLFVVNFHNTPRTAQFERPVESFARLYGSEYGLNAAAGNALGRSGYRYLFSNHKLQKLPG